MIRLFSEITNDGVLLEEGWRKKNIGENFKVVPVYGAQWYVGEKLVRKEYKYINSVYLIPDRSGVVAIERIESPIMDNKIVRYNAYGEVNFTAFPPGSDGAVRSGYIYVFFTKNNICKCGYYRNDHDYEGVLNVTNGEISEEKRIKL